MNWINGNKWFLLAVIALACALVYFRYDVVPSANVQAAYVLDHAALPPQN